MEGEKDVKEIAEKKTLLKIELWRKKFVKGKGNENKINNGMTRMKMNWHQENDEEEYKNEKKKRIYSKSQEVGGH